MSRESVDDLVAFLAVARQQSFTRAAAALGVSQPALSQTVRALEQRLGVRLLIRTTRSVSTTEAGERLLNAIGPHFDGIQDGLAALSELRDTPASLIWSPAPAGVIDPVKLFGWSSVNIPALSRNTIA